MKAGDKFTDRDGNKAIVQLSDEDSCIGCIYDRDSSRGCKAPSSISCLVKDDDTGKFVSFVFVKDEEE